MSDLELHVVNRLTYGPTPGLLAHVRDVGVDAFIDEQLDHRSLDDSDVQALIAGYRTLEGTNQENWAFINTSIQRFEVLYELRHAAALRAYASNRQLHEVMVDFWTNHFNVYFSLDDGVPDRHLKIRDEFEVTRPHALGRFADMLVASAHSAAMLKYLDNFSSRANSDRGVSENYGRELLELHTLGIIDGEQVYNEADMRGAALVMSGWSLNTSDDLDVFRYRESYHWQGPVSILGGAWSTPGRSGEAGYQDGLSLLDFLAHHPSTARYIAWKLCRRFVADKPPASLVESAAQVFLDNDTQIVPVLRHIFRSEEFRGAPSRFKRPTELMMAMMRTLGVVVEADPYGAAASSIRGQTGSLDHLVYGWEGPDGFPEDKADWVSADAMLRRWGMAGLLSRNALGGIRYEPMDLLPNPRPATAGQLLDHLAERLLYHELPNRDRAAFLTYLGLGENDAVTDEKLNAELPSLIGLFLSTSTYQYR